MDHWPSTESAMRKLREQGTYGIGFILGSIFQIGSSISDVVTCTLSETSCGLDRVDKLISVQFSTARKGLTLEEPSLTLSVVENADPPGPYLSSVHDCERKQNGIHDSIDPRCFHLVVDDRKKVLH